MRRINFVSFLNIALIDFEGDGFGGDALENVFGEGLVVGDADLLHEGGVGGEALDVGLGVEIEDAGFIGAVGVDLDFEVEEVFHGRGIGRQCNCRNDE